MHKHTPTPFRKGLKDIFFFIMGSDSLKSHKKFLWEPVGIFYN